MTFAAGLAKTNAIFLSKAEGVGLPVVYLGAMPENMVEGARIVLTGSIGENGAFTATNVAFGA